MFLLMQPLCTDTCLSTVVMYTTNITSSTIGGDTNQTVMKLALVNVCFTINLYLILEVAKLFLLPYS